jgi:uroporphyrinogen decarboxylase
LRWIDQIAQEVSSQIPVILYAKAPSDRLHYLSHCQVSGISIDHETDLVYARSILPSHYTLQGNLDPALLETNPDIVRQTTLQLLEKMKGDSGHILNLGHGIRPQAKVECMEELVQTVTNYSDS